MKSIFSLFILFFGLTGCFQKPSEIEVTTEYIRNEYWNKTSMISFEIEKMKVKQDSILNIFQHGFKGVSNNWNIVEKLETDSSFIYHYISNSTSIGDTVYFDKSKGGDWSTDFRMKDVSLGTTFKTIGNLQRDSWYKFSGLRSGQFYVLIYIDSIGKTYRFDQNLNNF